MQEENKETQGGADIPVCGLLDLSARERIVRLRERSKLYRHFFHPLTLRDWERFYAGFHAEALSAEGTYQFRSDSDRAACQLWDAKIKSVEGYGGGEADQLPLPQLRERMPARHKIAAVSLLQEAVPGDPEPSDLDLMAEEIPVVLSANWNEQVFNRLVHYFRRPTQDDELRHRRLAVHSFEVAGARTRRGGQTRILIPSKFRPLVDLYDSLIVRTEGYSLGVRRPATSDQPVMEPAPSLAAAGGRAEGSPSPALRGEESACQPALDRDVAIQHMDGVHKMVAVSLLFGESPEGAGSTAEDTEKESA